MELRLRRIFCISLLDSSRRLGFLSAFSSLSIPIDMIDATDGRFKKPEIPEWLQLFEPHPRYSAELRKEVPQLNCQLSNRELACTISHMRVWRTIAAFNHDDYVLICEDDAIPKNISNLESSLSLALKEMKNGEFVYVGYTGGLQNTRKFWPLRVVWHFLKQFPVYSSLQKTFRFNRSVFVTRMPRMGKTHLMKAGQHWGAFGYLINRKSAFELLRLNKDLEMTSDGTFRYAQLSGSIRMSVLRTGLIIVDGGYPSEIRSCVEHASNFKNCEFG
jgi:GR25 family glycosyltransferase involved in LPS biosynthesis